MVWAAADSALVPLPGVDLPDPPGIPVAGRAHENLGMQMAELECGDVSRGFRSVVSRLPHSYSRPHRLG